MSCPQSSSPVPWYQEALDLVWQGQAPTTWRVFWGKRNLRSPGCLMLGVFMLVLIAGFAVAGFASIFLVNKFENGDIRSSTIHEPLLTGVSVSQYWLIASIGIIALAFLLSLIAARFRKKLAPVLIILPEGWVEYPGWPGSATAITFAELAALQLVALQPESQSTERVVTLAELQHGTGPAQQPTAIPGGRSLPAIALTLVYRNGRRQTWRQQNASAPSEVICKALLNAYQDYSSRAP